MSRRKKDDDRKFAESSPIVERSSISRDNESREKIKRHLMNMIAKNPYQLDESEIPEGMERAWKRELLMGQPDENSLAKAREEGWTPVLASDLPHRQSSDFFGRENHAKPYIYRGGSILCERPKEFGDIQRKALADYNNQILTSLPGTDKFNREQGTGTRFEVSDERNVALQRKASIL